MQNPNWDRPFSILVYLILAIFSGALGAYTIYDLITAGSCTGIRTLIPGLEDLFYEIIGGPFTCFERKGIFYPEIGLILSIMGILFGTRKVYALVRKDIIPTGKKQIIIFFVLSFVLVFWVVYGIVLTKQNRPI